MSESRPVRRREVLILASGPVLGAAVGAVTNVITSTWNWWLFSALLVLIAVAAAGAALTPGSPPGPPARTAPPPGPRVSTLPPGSAVFAGREAELRALTDAAARREPHRPVVCAITGRSGSGKTELAVHAAHLLSGRYPDGVLFLPVRGHAPPSGRPHTTDLLVNALATLGAADPGRPGAEELSARWRSFLGQGRYLLVLDDLTESVQAQPLLPHSPYSLVLVTSRALLPGLDPDVHVRLDVLSTEEARSVATAILGRAGHQQVPGVAAQLAAAHRLPLTLRHAADRIVAEAESRTVTPSYRSRGPVRRRPAEMGHAPAGAEGDPPFVNPQGGPGEAELTADPFTRSLAELSPRELLVFRRAALHPGPRITAHRAAALAGLPVTAAGAALGALQRRGLLDGHAPGTDSGHTLHDRVRELADELSARQDSEAERAEARERLFRLTARQLGFAATEIGAPLLVEELSGGPAEGVPGGEKPALEWLARDLADLSAVARLAAEESWAQTWQLSSSLTYYLRIHRNLAQAEELNSAALRIATAAGQPRGQAHSHAQLGALARFGGAYQEALTHLGAAREAFAALDDTQGRAAVCAELGVVHQNLARYGPARDAMREAARLHDRLGNARGVANAKGTLGMIDRTAGDYPAARAHLTEALGLYLDLGNVRNEAWIRIELGTLDRLRGAYPRALREFTAARTLFSGAGDRSGTAWADRETGVTRRLLGEYGQAGELLEEALRVFTALGSRRNAADAQVELCTLLRITGAPEAARSRGTEALAAYTAMGNRRGEAWTTVELAVLDLGEGDYDAAADGLGRARDLYAAIGDRSGAARAELETGRLHLARGENEAARTHLAEALTLYTALGTPEAVRARALLDAAG